MPIDPIDRIKLSGTGVSEAHAKSLLDTIDETIETVNSVAIGGGGIGWIYCSDLNADGAGEVSGYIWQDPEETVLQSAIASTGNLLVEVRAGYPLIRVNGAEHSLPRDAGGGFFTGDVAIVLSESGDVLLEAISPDGVVGASDTFQVTLDAPPDFTALTFTGGYPGAQTALKEDDPFGIQGTADKPIDAIEVIDYEAGKGEVIPVAEDTVFSTIFAIADRGDTAVLRPARVRARSAATGAWGPTRDTNEAGSVDGTHVVNCNDLRPGVLIGTPDYPGAQTALKDSESATVPNTITNADSVVYSDPTGTQLDITNPTSDEDPKTVSRLIGDYNVGTPNFRIAASRVDNDSTTIANAVVAIAHVDPVVTVVEPAARLRSGGNNGTAIQNHTITIQSDQELLAAPSVDADSGGLRGTFTGSWSGGPSDWIRTLQVDDDDEKGAFTWESLSATNRAGKVVTTITGDGNYTLGGFALRNATFPAFDDTAEIDVEVADYSKVSFGTISQTNQPAVKQPISTSPPVANGMTIIAAGVSPTEVEWLDTDQVAANSGPPLAYVPVEEIV